MKGGRRLPAVAPHPGEDGGLRVCIDIPGLNRLASLERLWPSRVGRLWSTPQLHSHALRLAERGCHVPAPHEGHHGGSRGQAFRSPGGDGDGPQGTTSASGASRGPWAWGLVRTGFRSPPSQLHQHSFILNIIM